MPMPLSGHALSLVLFVLAQSGYFGLHFTIVAGLLTLATALFCRLWALLLHEQPSAAQLAAVSFQGLPTAPRAVQASALALVVVVAAMVIAFR